MTPQEIRDMSAAVAQHFGWFKWGVICRNPMNRVYDGSCKCYECGARDTRTAVGTYDTHLATHKHLHEIPPPDLTQAEWFVRLLRELHAAKHIVMFGDDVPCSILPRGEAELVVGEADTPELALLKAAYELVKK